MKNQMGKHRMRLTNKDDNLGKNKKHVLKVWLNVFLELCEVV